MKKFLGALLVLLGTVIAVLFGGAAGAIGSYESGMYSVLYIIMAVLGLAVIGLGRKLYRANGESPKTKTVVGRLMMIIGLLLAIFGAAFAFTWTVLDTDPIWVLGVTCLAAGLIYLLIGKSKVGADRKAAFNGGRTTNDKTDRRKKSESEKKEEKKVAPPPKPKVMVCAACGKTYPLGQVYCDECGSLLKETQRG